MRMIAALLLLACAACADSHALPKTSDSDPVWQLNVGKWVANTNDLTGAPGAVAIR